MPTLTATTTAVPPSSSTSMKFRNGLPSASSSPQPVLTSSLLPEWIDTAPVIYYPLPSINSIVYHSHGHHHQYPQPPPPPTQLHHQQVHLPRHHQQQQQSLNLIASSTSSKRKLTRNQRNGLTFPRFTNGTLVMSQKTEDDLGGVGPVSVTESETPKSQESITFEEVLNSTALDTNSVSLGSVTLSKCNGTSASSASSASSTSQKLPICRETIMLSKHIFEWSVEDVSAWLTLNHFQPYIALFCDRHRIDGRVLVNLSADDFRAEPLSLTVFGDIKRLCMGIAAIRDYYSTTGSTFESTMKRTNGHSARVVSATGQHWQSRKSKLTTFTKQSTGSVYPYQTATDPTKQSRSMQRTRSSKASLRSYPTVSKNQSFQAQGTYRQHHQQIDDSTEDDFDRSGAEPIMYDDDDDEEDDIDEIEIRDETEQQQQQQQQQLDPPHYTLPTNFQQYNGPSNGNTPPNYFPQKRRSSQSDSESDSSSMSTDSNDSRGSTGSSTVSLTSMSKCNSDSCPVEYPHPAEPIPVNVYVHPKGSGPTGGRQIQAQIIPTMTSNAQLAKMTAYYSTAQSYQQQPSQLNRSQAPALYQAPPNYPSHYPNGAPLMPQQNGPATSKKRTGHRGRNHGHHNSHHRHGHHGHRKTEFKPEAWKAIVAMIYFFASTWVTAIVMVIVHDRVPDMDTYPPLPDILLDNLPLIPWAFGMCEFCGLVLFIIWSMILIFHKHRFILLRRMFSLFGSVFLLRCVTMLITSLSVPGRHLECKARPYGSWMERIHQAYLIWQGGGMSIQGVRTCGDYMFSGHTVVLTLMNFFITEYTPTKYYLVHTLSWVLNLFGIFFILAAHEHYSIDVFIAFYISTRLFLYYHTLANNRALYQRDRHRTRIWFPLFYFFESSVNGIVPNHYEVPFRKLKVRLVAFIVDKFRALLALGVPVLIGGCREEERSRQQQQQQSSSVKRTSSNASSSSHESTSSAGAQANQLNHNGPKVKTQ